MMRFIDRRQFCQIKGLQGFFYELISPGAMQMLLDQFQPYYLRRTQEFLLQTLPSKSELIVPVTMSSLQQQQRPRKAVPKRKNHKVMFLCLLTAIIDKNDLYRNLKTSQQARDQSRFFLVSINLHHHRYHPPHPHHQQAQHFIRIIVLHLL